MGNRKDQVHAASRAAGRIGSKAFGETTPDVVNEENGIGAMLGASDDELFTTRAGEALRSFLKGVAGFFNTANAIEASALARLDRANALARTPPATREADAAVQRFVLDTNTEKKIAEEHWNITTTVHHLHRRLTAKRAKATGALEQAAAIGVRLHTAYVDRERVRQQEEQDRIDREAREKAERERQAELDKLEQLAVTREEASADLSDREKRFVELFAFGLNTGETSARSAGFKEPKKAASRLLGMEKIQRAVKATQEAAALRRQAKATAEKPLDVRPTETVQSNVDKVGSDRRTWRGEVFNETEFIAAVIAGKHGIPWDVLTVNQAKLTEYARGMHELMNRWPGVRAVPKDGLV
jgi:hypothetical protein